MASARVAGEMSVVEASGELAPPVGCGDAWLGGVSEMPVSARGILPKMSPRGTNGATSTAPTQGWVPVWVRMSMKWRAVSMSAEQLATTSRGDPIKVMTVLLADALVSRCATYAPAAPAAATSSSIAAASRPRLILGTASRSCLLCGGRSGRDIMRWLRGNYCVPAS